MTTNKGENIMKTLIIETKKYKGHTIAKTKKISHFARGSAHIYIIVDGRFCNHFNPDWDFLHSWSDCKFFINKHIDIEKDNNQLK